MLFRDSLCAALTPDEEGAGDGPGMIEADVRMTSDRHWTLTYRKPLATS